MGTTTKNAIVAEITAAVMQTLMAKGLIELDEQKPKKVKPTRRLPDGKSATISDILSDAKEEARENGKKVYEVQEKGLTIMEYSERSYAIVGDTKGLKDFLKERGAYRYAVVYGFADNTAKGWLVSKKKFDEACKGLEAFKRDMDSKGYHVTIGESLKAINEAYKAEHPREEKGERKKISTFEKSYQILKEKHPDAILLFRAGDFYETYFNDAKVVSEILGIVLTNQGDKNMAGFPHHSLDIYLPALIRAGKRVIICDPIEEGGINKKEVYRQGGTTFVTEQKDKTVNVVPLQQSESFEGVGYTPKKTVKGEFEHTVMDNVFKHGNGFYMCIGSDNGENNFLFVAGGNVENDKEKMERIATIAKEGLPQAYSKGIVKKIYQWQMDAYKVADKESYEWLKSHVKEISA